MNAGFQHTLGKAGLEVGALRAVEIVLKGVAHDVRRAGSRLEDVYKRQGDGVLVDGDEALVQATLDLLTGDVEVADVDEHEAVSYTHLDVYKRQDVVKVGRIPDDQVAELALFNRTDLVGHVDVYKRQR